ncbi:MAG: type IV secretory system conjugative DNA transfer family protein [Hymenobacter sp.]|nr:MAG: type IV secretory system conjugative DNA transfer family protein [Hymenobacter sp.]
MCAAPKKHQKFILDCKPTFHPLPTMQADFQQRADAFKRTFWADIKSLFTPKPDPERRIWRTLIIVGLVASLCLAGALLGFVFAYKRLSFPRRKPARLDGQPSAVYAAMIAGGLLVLLLPVLFGIVTFTLFQISATLGAISGVIVAWLVSNIFSTALIIALFAKWRHGMDMYFMETGRYGNARYAFPEELDQYTQPEGFYIGGGFYYNKPGHLLTVAGTRAGKGVNLIIPNLLKTGHFKGSWVIIDPKGENAAIAASTQRETGKNVVILNPWELLGLGQAPYNPLDLLKNDRLNLSDDVQMIAECIVPSSADGDTSHFDNRARTVIAGLLLHLVTTDEKENQHLGTLWEWLRLPDEQWQNLLVTMSENDSPIAGDIVKATANEIVALKANSEKEYGSVISTAQKWTDFLKSPALRTSLTPTAGGFDSSMLTDGNTVVYLIIPADRLKTHAQWLRLCVCTLMRSVIRKPNQDVCFLLDEFFALGYLSEIEIALGAYAGYGVHVWAILQNLVQLERTYGTNWENFISSCGVRHFFNVSDITTANYVSQLIGTTSIPTYDLLGNLTGATGRNLINADELRLLSNDRMYLVADHTPPAQVPKIPYYSMPELTEGRDYSKNPYQDRGKKLA